MESIWYLQDGFVYVNNMRMRSSSGKEFGKLIEIKPGKKATLIWMKLEGEDRGVILNRNSYHQECGLAVDQSSNHSFTQSILAAWDWVQQTKRHFQPPAKRTHAEAFIASNDIDQIPTEPLECLQDKFFASMKLHVDSLKHAPIPFTMRPINKKWVQELKTRLLTNSMLNSTILPVFIDTQQCRTAEEVKLEDIEQYNIFIIGGNHLVKAIGELRKEYPNNEKIKALEVFHCHIYVGLDQQECLKLSLWHNSVLNSQQITFQDQVRLARRMLHGTDEVPNARVYLENVLRTTCGTVGNLPVITNVAQYSDESFRLTEDLFQSTPDFASFPQAVCVFIAFAVVYGGVTANTGAPRDSPLIYNPARRYEAWRYLTYMFLHEGYIHIIFNVLVQLVLGIPLEMVHKWWRVAIVYMLGVIAGSCAHSVTDRWTLLAGASGGVYALIGAHLAVIVMNWKEMNHEWMGSVARVLSSGPARLIFWIITPAIDLIIALYQRYGLEEDSKVGYAAHLGGALVGFLLGVPVMRNLHHRFWEEVLFYICLVIYILCMLFAIVWNIIYQDYPTTDWRNCCPDPIITKGDIDN